MVEPYSVKLPTSLSWYPQEEPGFADAIYPSTWDFFMEGLSPKHLGTRENLALTSCSLEKMEVFDGDAWTTWTGLHWELPIATVSLYCLMLIFLPGWMKDRERIRPSKLKTVWNFGLSFFSMWGVYVTWPHLLFDEYGGLFTVGLSKSVCQHASNFGCGRVGVAVAAFIFSKNFELIDTLWLLLSKKELIVLHWYHHITVLLFCHLAYATRSGTGIYFAAVNYFIHSIMYFYYGMTQMSDYTRKLARPYAWPITMLQLSQMAFGLMIIGVNVYFRYHREWCYTFPTVNILALIMYFSYFILFMELFLNRYYWKKPDSKKKKAA